LNFARVWGNTSFCEDYR